MGMMDLLSGLLAVKQIVKLWPEKGLGWRQTSFSVIFRTEPFYSRFPYVFRLLDFFFDTELLKYFQFRMYVIAYFRVLLFRPILAECI